MKYLLIAIASVFALHLGAQNFIDQNFSSLEDLDESKVIHVSAKSFDIASHIVPDDDEEAAEIKEFIASIYAVDVVAVPDYAAAKDDYRKAVDLLASGYEELMSYKEKGSRFSLHIDATGDVVHEVVGVGYGDDSEFVLISVTGEMDLDMISKALESMPMDDIAIVRDFKRTGSDEFKVYPNPAAAGADLTVEVPEGFSDQRARVLDLSGAQRAAYDVVDGRVRINTSDLGAGTYYVIIEDGGLSLKKKFIVLK